MNRTKKSFLVAGNWKMNPSSHKEAKKTFKEIKGVAQKSRTVQTVVFPPVVYLNEITSDVIKKCSLGAQDIFWEEEGSYTGQISASMIKSYKAQYILLGHSELRTLGETDALINKKLKTALKHELKPVVCVGEQTRDTEGWYLHTIKTQLEACFAGIAKKAIKDIVIAYEPVWAIGKGATREASKEEADEMAIYIKRVISTLYDTATASVVRVIYGGSVNTKNCTSFLEAGHVDGLLVGRESLSGKKFGEIIQLVDNLK
jgi:triosephosphate isomerase